MRDITITANDAERRLDRFLRKYLKNATLSEIYRFIRKDIKVNGKRREQSYILSEGDVLTFFIADDVLDKMIGADAAGSGRSKASARQNGHKARRQFRIIYEDDNLLAADKPFGLLTHGDAHEKKNHLANQVRDYLIETGEYDPRAEKVFSPAPANRIDRNTTGLVIFGKNSVSLKALNKMIREDMIDKYYLTIVHGELKESTTLTGNLVKDELANKVTVTDEGLSITTVVSPVEVIDCGHGRKVTLAEVRLVTGRSHQIRAHLASIGHSVIGDVKYASAADRQANEYFAQKFSLTTQLLHAYRLEFRETTEELAYMKGKTITAPLPDKFNSILERLRSGQTRNRK